MVIDHNLTQVSILELSRYLTLKSKYDCLLLLFYAMATIFQLYLGSDMMYVMRRKFEPTLVLTQGIFNLPHHDIGIA